MVTKLNRWQIGRFYRPKLKKKKQVNRKLFCVWSSVVTGGKKFIFLVKRVFVKTCSILICKSLVTVIKTTNQPQKSRKIENNRALLVRRGLEK